MPEEVRLQEEGEDAQREDRGGETTLFEDSPGNTHTKQQTHARSAALCLVGGEEGRMGVSIDDGNIVVLKKGCFIP